MFISKTNITLQEGTKNTSFTNLNGDLPVIWECCFLRDANLTNTSRYAQQLFK